MPELTPKLGIKKPLGNETVSRAAFNENWDIIDQKAVGDMGGVPSIQAGLDANKPTAGTAGRLYVATDTQIIYRDTGTAWTKIGVVKWGDIEEKPDLALASDLAAHQADDMPHRFIDATTNKTYQYGFKQQNNHLVFVYQEVV